MHCRRTLTLRIRVILMIRKIALGRGRVALKLPTEFYESVFENHNGDILTSVCVD